MPRSYQVRPAILGRRRATKHASVRPAGRQKVNESARRQPENQPRRSDVTAQPSDSDSEKVKCSGSWHPLWRESSLVRVTTSKAQVLGLISAARLGSCECLQDARPRVAPAPSARPVALPVAVVAGRPPRTARELALVSLLALDSAEPDAGPYARAHLRQLEPAQLLAGQRRPSEGVVLFLGQQVPEQHASLRAVATTAIW